MNPQMIQAILQLLMQDPGLIQEAQYGRDYHNNPQAGEYESYPQTTPGITNIPRGPRLNESYQPRGVDPRQPRGLYPPQQGNGGSVGDDFYNDPRFRKRY